MDENGTVYVATAIWKDLRACEIIGHSTDFNAIANEVVRWAINAKDEFNIPFEQNSTEEMKAFLSKNWFLASVGAGEESVEDWVFYSIESSNEIN